MNGQYLICLTSWGLKGAGKLRISEGELEGVGGSLRLSPQVCWCGGASPGRGFVLSASPPYPLGRREGPGGGLSEKKQKCLLMMA